LEKCIFGADESIGFGTFQALRREKKNGMKTENGTNKNGRNKSEKRIENGTNKNARTTGKQFFLQLIYIYICMK